MKKTSELIDNFRQNVLANMHRLESENQRLQRWVHDLQSGMYINCVYCGHRYGPKESTSVTMADILKQHIEICPLHPMSELKKENEILRACNEEMIEKIHDLEHGINT
jgi:cell division protein FtsB